MLKERNLELNFIRRFLFSTLSEVLTEGNEFVYVAVYSSEQVLLNRFANKLQGCIGNSSCSTLGVPSDVVSIASNPFLVDPVPKSGRLQVDPETGDGLVTDFLLKQTSWVDNSPPEELEYKFSVFDRKTGRIQVTSLASFEWRSCSFI